MPTVTVEEFRELLAEGAARPFDVRSAAEFAVDHIPGTINIPMEQIESRMADVPVEPLVLVCEAGKRAQIVAGWLEGKRQTAVLEGGMRSWRKAGLPTVGCAGDQLHGVDDAVHRCLIHNTLVHAPEIQVAITQGVAV